MRNILLFAICSLYYAMCEYDGILPRLPRSKRDATGALDIVTNHAKPIHADVKNDNTAVEKPCPKTYVQNLPFVIEPGTVFQVTAPKDTLYQGKSFRKSYPLSSRLDLVRAVSRVVTLLALVFSALVEFYPSVQYLYYMVYDFMYPNY